MLIIPDISLALGFTFNIFCQLRIGIICKTHNILSEVWHFNYDISVINYRIRMSTNINSSQSSLKKWSSAFGNSVVSLRSLISNNKVQPDDFNNSEVFYEIKEFDNYLPPVDKSLQANPSTKDIQNDTNSTVMKRILSVIRS